MAKATPHYETLCRAAKSKGWKVGLSIYSPAGPLNPSERHSTLDALYVIPRDQKAVEQRLVTVWILSRPIEAAAETALVRLTQEGVL